eukprot:g9552.t1
MVPSGFSVVADPVALWSRLVSGSLAEFSISGRRGVAATTRVLHSPSTPSRNAPVDLSAGGLDSHGAVL